MRFYLGTHVPSHARSTAVPLFLSARRLRCYRTPPRPQGPWALDSGGFSELTLYGGWVTTHGAYAAEAVRWCDAMGTPDFAAPCDWMCEPHLLAKTGLGVGEHQRRTVASYLTLRDTAPSVPWAPVLQGWTLSDYLRCRDLYDAAGVDLAALPVVGLGSVCRRQGTIEADGIVRALYADGLHNLHGFGFKTLGLIRCGHLLASADSMAWSFAARRDAPLPGHQGKHKNCANCLDYALGWRARVLSQLAYATPAPIAPDLFAGCH